MAKFRLSATTIFTLDGNAIPCPTTVTFNEVNDNYMSVCAGNTIKANVAGLGNITGSITGEVDAAGAATLAYIDVNVAGALVLRPTGATTGELDITSTNMQIASLDLAMTTTGLTAYTANFVCDDLTWGAVPA